MKDIRITDGNTVVRAVLNDTAAAKDFERRLPFRCSGSDSGIDYCCRAASGLFDPMELQAGWKNGDISLCDGWLALLYAGEEESFTHRSMMIIGHVVEADLPKVKSMPEKVTLTITAAEPQP